MTPRVKPPHTLVSVLHWLWYCRATALSALANITLLLGKNTLPFPAFGNLNFVSPPHRRAYTSIPKSRPNIRFPHQQDFFPIRNVTKSSTARFSHENLVEKFKIFVQDFVPIRTALKIQFFSFQFFFSLQENSGSFKAVVKFEHPRIPAFQPFMKPVSYFLRKQFHAVQCLYQL